MFAYGPAGGEVLSERSKMAPVLVAQDQHQSWPLYVIPAIKKCFRDLAVSHIINFTLEEWA